MHQHDDDQAHYAQHAPEIAPQERHAEFGDHAEARASVREMIDGGIRTRLHLEHGAVGGDALAERKDAAVRKRVHVMRLDARRAIEPAQRSIDRLSGGAMSAPGIGVYKKNARCGAVHRLVWVHDDAIRTAQGQRLRLSRYRMRAAVIGAGIIGASAALELTARGCDVTLFEQFDVDHDLGSSFGDSRIIRMFYDDPYYTALMPDAFALWQRLETMSGQTLYEKFGGLYYGPSGHPRIASAAAGMRAAGVTVDV